MMFCGHKKMALESEVWEYRVSHIFERDKTGTWSIEEEEEENPIINSGSSRLGFPLAHREWDWGSAESSADVIWGKERSQRKRRWDPKLCRMTREEPLQKGEEKPCAETRLVLLRCVTWAPHFKPWMGARWAQKFVRAFKTVVVWWQISAAVLPHPPGRAAFKRGGGERKPFLSIFPPPSTAPMRVAALLHTVFAEKTKPGEEKGRKKWGKKGLA